MTFRRAVRTVRVSGIGQVAHFGNAVMISPVCLASDFSVIGEWSFTIIAANGDEASGVVTGFVHTDYGFDLVATVTGGTGRLPAPRVN